MKTFILLFSLVAGFSFFSHAQDILVNKDGSTIKCKVISVGVEVITYKKFNYLEGPDYLIKKADVTRIIFENGNIEEINAVDKTGGSQPKNADYEGRKGYIAITLGAALPQGDFGDAELTNPASGLAKTGLQLNLINFGYRFSKNIGIAGLWSGAAHNMEYFDDGTWSEGYFLGGLLITFPSEKVDFDIRVLGGYISANVELTSVQLKGSGTDFGYDLGVLSRIHFSQRTSFIVAIDYTGGKPTISTNDGMEFTQKIETINITAGIAFRLK